MISVVIPVYNEEKGVANTLKELDAVLKAGGLKDLEIILVDDGSDDDTVKAAELSGVSISILSNLVNSGYGYCLKQGIKEARFDTILITDGDGSYPVEQLTSLLATYRKGYDLVVASREKNFIEDSLFKNIFRWILRWLVEFTAGIKVPDVNSGMRIFSKSTIEPYFPFLSDRFSFTTSMTLHYALDKKMIRFVPNGYRKRVGKSKVKLGRDMLRTLQFIIEIIALKNPLKLHLLMMIPGALLLIVLSIGALAGKIPALFPLLTFLLLCVQLSILVLGIQRKHSS
jgi:polyisoprenyl-phosphate glycosyltransferase